MNKGLSSTMLIALVLILILCILGCTPDEPINEPPQDSTSAVDNILNGMREFPFECVSSYPKQTQAVLLLFNYEGIYPNDLEI